MKSGLQLLRDVTYLGKAYHKAWTNDNRTLTYIEVLFGIIGLFWIPFAWLAANTKMFPVDISLLLVITSPLPLLTLPWLIPLIYKQGFARRWKTLHKLQSKIDAVVVDFEWCSVDTVYADRMFKKYTKKFVKWKMIYKKRFYPSEKDFATSAKTLDYEFTHLAMCRGSGLGGSCRSWLPESMAKLVGDDGTVLAKKDS